MTHTQKIIIGVLCIFAFTFSQTAFAKLCLDENGNMIGCPASGFTTSDNAADSFSPVPTDTTPTASAATSPTGFVTFKAGSGLYEACRKSHSIAKQSCNDPNSTAGMSNSGRAKLEAGLAAIAAIVAQVAAAKGSSTMCYAASGLSTVLQGLTALKGDTCNSSKNNCTDECKRAFDALDDSYQAEMQKTDPASKDPNIVKYFNRWASDSDSSVGICDNFTASVTAMQAQYQGLLGTAATALNCGKQSSSLAAAPPTAALLTTGVGDCSNASFAATSTYCICKANPSDGLCVHSVNGTTPTGSGVAGGGGIATPGLGTGSADDVAAVDTSDIRQKGQTGSLAGGAGAGGGGLGGGSSGGGGPGAGSEGDGTGASGIDKNVITGASSGGGGLAGLSSGGGGGGGGLGRGSSGSGGGSGGGFNLSKYLPKSLFKNRGIAGMSLPATDGVTGPTGPTIWEKVHTRYEDKKSTLIQDK